MKKKFICIFVFLAALILPLTNVNAATYRWKRMPLNSFISEYYSGMKINGYDVVLGSYSGYRTIEAHVVEDGSNTYHGYCLHVGKEIYSDASVGLHDGFGDLRDSAGNILDETRQSVLKNILASGYQNGNGNIDNFVSGEYVHHNNTVGTCVNTEICTKVLATQLLVWEVQTNARNDYSRSPKGNDAYNKFVNNNTNLYNAYTNILDDAEYLTKKDNFPASGKTYILKWKDSDDKYESDHINVGPYTILNPDTSGVTVSAKDSNSQVVVSSTSEIKNPISIKAKLVKGSTLESSETFRWYRFLDYSDAQDVLMGNYSVTLEDSFNVKTESGKFVISKVDADTGKIVKGSKFNLYKCSGGNCANKNFVQEIDLTQNAQNVEVLVNKSGKYLLEESAVPYGYTKIGDFTFDLKIDENGKANISNVSSPDANIQMNDDNTLVKLSLVVKNKAKKILINKIDGSTNKPLNGATFQIKDKNGNLVKFEEKNGVYRYSTTGTITELVDSTKNQYSISLLPEGEYTIVETDVPYPYVLAGKKSDRETKIKIDKNSDLYVYNTTTKKYDKTTNATVTIKNFKTKVIIEKTGTSAKPLKGVIFELYDSKKEKLIPLIKNEKTGEYDYPQFFISEFDNNMSGSNVTNSVQIITDEKGKAVINYLSPGKYYLKEVYTVDGYEITEENEWTEINVVVGRESTTKYHATICNAKSEFSFYKIDEDGNYLNDGKFKLQVYNEKTSKFEDVALIYHEKDDYYTIDKTGKSDIYIFTPKNGVVTFKEIDSKTKYRVVEIEAPDGFVLPKASEAYVELIVSENGYVSGSSVLINKKITVEEEATAQAELIINISTGQDRIRYVLIIGGILFIIVGLFILKGKLKK